MTYTSDTVFRSKGQRSRSQGHRLFDRLRNVLALYESQLSAKTY